jgi:hypothetical protein
MIRPRMGCTVQGRIAQGRNVRRCYVRGRIILLPFESTGAILQTSHVHHWIQYYIGENIRIISNKATKILLKVFPKMYHWSQTGRS